MLRTSTNDKNDLKINTPSRCTIIAIFNTAGGYAAVFFIGIGSNAQCTATRLTGDSRVNPEITLNDGVLTISEGPWLSTTLISSSLLSEIK